MRYAVDPSVRSLDGGTRLLGGSPLKLLKLSAAGSRFLERIERGDDVTAIGRGPQAVLDRLLDAGIVHPVPTRPGSHSAGDVTVVIPAYRYFDPVVLEGAHGVARVIVVDDGSPEPLVVPRGVEVVRRSENGGPGAARQSGLARVTTPLVAFLDTDTRPAPGWLDGLLPHFDDPRVGLVAPRVTAPPAPGGRVLARYESVRSPLDLGPEPARIRARTRVSYVPGAALVLRTAAAREVGGFAPDLRVGEDVDLVWRLDRAGWRGRYEPAVAVVHAARETLTAWCRQRAAYGTSAGPLSRRHPGALAPLGVSGWSAASWSLAAAGCPVTGGLVAGATTVLLAPKLDVEHPWREALQIAGRGHLAAGEQIADAIRRVWWPLALLAAWRSRRLRPALLAGFVVPPLLEWARRRPPVDPLTWTALRVADDASYGAGVWWGAARAATLAPLAPDLTSWPRPPRTGSRARWRLPLTSPGR